MNVVKERPLGWCCFYWDILGQIAHAEWHCFPRERKGQTGPQTAIQYCNHVKCAQAGALSLWKVSTHTGNSVRMTAAACCIHRLGRVYFSEIFGNGLMYNVFDSQMNKSRHQRWDLNCIHVHFWPILCKIILNAPTPLWYLMSVYSDRTSRIWNAN